MHSIFEKCISLQKLPVPEGAPAEGEPADAVAADAAPAEEVTIDSDTVGGGVKWVIFKTEETTYQAICL